MNIKKRRAVSYIAGRLVASKPSSGVYDYTTRERYKINGDVSLGYVQVYDGDRGGYIIGGATPAGLSLFDYYTRQHVRLNISGDDFYGYDYETGSYFSGEVRGSSVSFFDYQNSKYYRYAI